MSFDFGLFLEKGRQLEAEGASDEELLRLFRKEEASMLESVKLMKQLKTISLREAQDLVHSSETWADQREDHERLQEDFAKALRQLEQETSGS